MLKSSIVRPIKESLLALKSEPHKLSNGNLAYFNIYTATQVPYERLLHSPVADYFYGSKGGRAVNLVWSGKPVFFIRLHGSYPKHSYQLLRRTSVTELDNAYIVFADNYLVRHVWELHFFGYFEQSQAKGISLVEALHKLIQNAELHVAGQLVSEEKPLAFFKCIAPKTSGTDLYFSHYFDVCGNYTIIGKSISYQEFAAKHQVWLSAGDQQEWTNSNTELLNRKVRRLPVQLTEDDLSFLRAYNVRLLAPAFMFTFPYSRKFSGSINQISFTSRSGFGLGETPQVRRLFFQHFYKDLSTQNGGSSFKQLMEQGGVSEAELRQMLEVQDVVELQSVDDVVAKASVTPTVLKAKAIKGPKAPKAQQASTAILVRTPGGGELSARSMPGIVAAILEDYAQANQLNHLHQLLNGDTRLESILYADLSSGEVHKVHTRETVRKSFPNGRAAYKKTYTIGAETGILTTQWRSGDYDNFTNFKEWATDRGYIFQ